MYSSKRLLPPTPTGRRAISALTVALAAAGFLPSVQAQLQTAGDLLVNVDATSAPIGSLNTIPNSGTLGGVFQATGAAADKPVVGPTYGNGTRAMHFDGTDYLQLVAAAGGAKIAPPAGLVGANPTSTIEAWVLNPGLDREETIVSWGKRGGPDGSNKSFNFGWDARWGAVGHWGGPDLGWDSSVDADLFAPGNPAPGVWHHLVLTFDGTTSRAYADGVLKNTEAVTLNTHPNTAITIAAQLEADGATVTGALRGSLAIGRLRIHDGTLTDAQVASNYALERADFVDGAGSPAPGPIHRYSFNQAAGSAATGTVVVDSAGGGDGVVLGDGAASTGSRISLPGGGSGSAAYIDLPNGMISKSSQDNGGSGKLTIEGWSKVTGVQNWARIFDFGSSDVADPGLIGGEVTGPGGGGEGLDYLFFSASEGGRPDLHALGMRNIDPPSGGGIDTRIGFAGLNVDFHFAITWDENTGIITAYKDGGEVLKATLPDPAGADRMSKINDVNVWLGRSNWTGDSNMQGEYDEFRIYDRVLTGDEVRNSFRAGPDTAPAPAALGFAKQPLSQTVQQAGDVTFSVGVQGVRPYTFQWFKNGAELPGATSHQLSLSNVGPADNATTYYCVVRNGSATATSETATLTVITPLPPQISSVTPQLNFTTLTVVFENKVQASSAELVANYAIAGLTVNSAALAADGKTLTLTTTPMAEGANYTLAISNVKDAAGISTITPNPTTRDFTTLVFSPGFIFRQYYYDIGGSVDAQALLDSPKYKNNAPDYTCLTNLAEANAGDTCDNCGEQLLGWFVPQVSGEHVFYLAADDGGRLFLGTDASPASKVLVAREPVWASRRQWTGEAAGGGRGTPPANVSAPINLVAGQRYYIEAVAKEGGGGDHLAVAVQAPGAAIPENGSTPIRSENLGIFTSLAGSSLTINQQPANVNAVVNQTVTFTVQATGSSSLCGGAISYQWRRDGVVMPGENQATLTLPQVSMSDSGASFSCVVAVPGRVLTSASATLTVSEDQSGPTVVAVTASSTLSNLVVRFNELVEELTAADDFNYTVDDGSTVSVLDAVLNADRTSVNLTLDGVLAIDSAHTLTVAGIHDLVGNTIDPDPTVVNFRTPVLSCGFALQELYFGIGGVAVGDLRNSSAFPNSPNAISYVGSLEGPINAFDNYGARLTGWLLPPVSGNYNFFVSADDGGEFWLSTDANPANRVLVCAEPVWNGSRDWLGTARRNAAAPENRSSTLFPAGIPLVAGEKYFFEMIYKEGGGGDNGAVTWQLPGAPLPANGSAPIPGAYLASLAQPANASITIAQQPADVFYVIDPLNTASGGSTLFTQDFTTGNGGYTVENSGSPARPWAYNSANGTWSCYHTDPCGPAQNASRLISAPITATRTGRAGLVLTHRYSFEGDNWDGGQIRVSINGGPFQTVPASAFSEGGYTSGALVGNHQLGGQAAFNGNSPDFAAGANITSRASIGFVSAGDVIRVQMLAAWDECSAGTYDPSWVVDAVAITEGAQDPTLRLVATGSIDGNPNQTPFVQWERDNGSGWLPLAGANSLNLTLNPVLADNGAKYRARLYVPGASAITREAVLTVKQLNTPPSFTLRAPTACSVEDSGPVTVAGVVSAIRPHSIPGAGAEVEAGQTVQLAISNNNPSLFSAQPAIDASGALTYTPAANASGQATVTIVATDDGGTEFGGRNRSETTFNICVSPANDCPTLAAVPAITVESGATASGQLVGADRDGDALRYVIVSAAQHGTVTLGATTGAFTYSPNAGYSGPDSFTAAAVDAAGCRSDAITVSITVRGGATNRCPVAVSDVGPAVDLFLCGAETVIIAGDYTSPQTRCEDGRAKVILDGTDSRDADGNPLTYSWFSIEENGVPVPLATGAQTNVFLEPGMYTIRLVVDDGQCEDTMDVDIHVITPAEAIAAVIDDIKGAALGSRNRRPLISLLKSASACFDRCLCDSGVRQLQAFVRKVQAQIEPEKPDLAAMLIGKAQEILDRVDCGQP